MNFRHIIMGALCGLAWTPAVHATEVCIAIAEAGTGAVLVQRGDCQRQVTPASTFKIAISLMGYDSGFLKDAHAPKLPFRPGYIDWRPSWREPTDPAKWMSDSVVWYSQQVTKSLGMQRFADYTRNFKYGNADVSGDAENDGLSMSWISSSLRISPLEQLAFLDKIVNRRLGVSAHAYDMTAQLTKFDRPPAGWRINGKTGAASGYGWYVGWASKGSRTFVFAHLMQRDATQPQDVPAGVLARDEFLKELPGLMIKDMVDRAVQPLMKKYDIPGMAVAVTDNGKNYFFNYGLASRETGQAVTSHTLFEIGSLSKTMAATLTSYAQVNGQLALTDTVGRHMPKLRGGSFDKISLLNLGTHTAGDFPMQVPDDIQTYDQLMEYYKNWKPGVAAGSARTYSNLTVGLLGIITAQSMGMPFAEAMENKLFPQLGMHHSYINMPAAEMKNYAQGYNQANAPVRVNPAVLATEAYGVKTDAADLIRFVDANMGLVKLDEKLQRAVTGTHTAYFKTGELTQDLIWEQYPAASKLDRMLAGVSEKMVFESNPATRLAPPIPPQADVLINKTGSNGGFGAYALFNPGKKIGIVMLANKSYPGAERVTAAWHILDQLDQR